MTVKDHVKLVAWAFLVVLGLLLILGIAIAVWYVDPIPYFMENKI